MKLRKVIFVATTMVAILFASKATYATWYYPNTYKHTGAIYEGWMYCQTPVAGIACWCPDLSNHYDHIPEDAYVPSRFQYSYNGVSYTFDVVSVGYFFGDYWRGSVEATNQALAEIYPDEDRWYSPYNCEWSWPGRLSPIKHLYIEDGIKEITESAFGGWNGLEDIRLPAGLRTIRGQTFIGCSKLREIQIPNGVTNIGHHAFAGCSNLVSVIWPTSEFRIQPGAFCGTGLVNIQVPERCIDISDSSGKFNGYTSPAVPYGVYGGVGVFENCRNLTVVPLPKRIKRIPTQYVFGCPNITSFDFSGKTEIGRLAFCATGITDLVLPSSVTNVGECAFELCSRLESVSIQGDIKDSGGSAFYLCQNLISVDLGHAITVLSDGMFNYCNKLEEIVVPSSVKEIRYAFSDCTNLKRFVFRGVPPKMVRQSAIGDNPVGYYLKSFEKEWKGAVDSEGMWYGLKMVEYTLPELTGTIAVSSSVNLNWTKSGFGDSTHYDLYRGTNNNFNAATCIAKDLTGLVFEDKMWSQTYEHVSALQYWVVARDGDFEVRSDRATVEVGNVIADENFEYTLIGSEYAKVKRYIGSQTGEVVIPDVVMLNAFGMVTKDLGLSVGSRKVIGIGEDAFRTATMQYVKIPEGVRDIGRYAFYGCDNLRSIVIPNTVEWIGECAFASCPSLAEATIDGKALSLSTRCFAEDSALQEVHIGDGVLDLPRFENATSASGAFYNCNSLRKVTIGSGIHEFPAYAFYGLSKLAELSVAGRVRWIGDEAFRGCTNLEQLDGDVRPVEIGHHAFVGSEIMGLDFSACEIVGNGAFDGCVNFLGEIRNGSGGCLDLPVIKSVQAEAFRGSALLTTLRFGSSLVYLGSEAFLNSGVTYVFFAGPHPATSGIDSFGNGTDTPPAGAYHLDNWSDWASVIDPDTLTWNGLCFIPTENDRRVIECSFEAQQGEPQSEFDVKKAVAVLYKKINENYVEIDRSGRQFQTFTVGDGTYRIEFQYADDTWVAANYSTELTVSQDSPGWAMEVEGRYIKAADTWSLWVQLYANEGDDRPYAEYLYRGDARNWDEISCTSFDPNIDIPLSDLDWPLWALQSEEEVEWYEYDVIKREAGSRMSVGRVAGRRCITVWEKDVPYNMLRLVAKKKKVKKTVEIKFYKWEWKLFSIWAFAPEGATTGAYVSPAIRDGERTEESFTVEDCEGISFVWKTSCEDAAAEGPQGDHGEFLVDGKVVATRAGESDWIRVSIDFEDTGSHTITWRYVKDASGSSGDDCMWVSCINVEPIAAENPELAIETEQLPSVMEMEEYEEQLECSGGTEPYWWSMDEADYLAVAEESTFSEVGEAQGWRKNDGEWVYDLPFAFNFGGRVYDSVVVSDNACLYFALGSNTDAIETSLGDLYSESADQDIFVERASDHVTFRWKRVLYSDRESEVNCSITLNADGTIRCSFGDSSYDSRQVWLSTARSGAEAEQSGDDDVVFVPNYLPFGLWLDEETGVIYGAPEQAGHYAFNVYVGDGEGAISSKRVTLDVEANPNDHSSGYRIVFDARDGAGAMSVQIVQSACVYKLPKCTLKPPEGKTRFAGWAGSNGRRYDDEMLVFNLAQPGETVTMTAIWDGEGGQQKELGGVQLWEGGPYWAECNVGATKPEECGYYFWWGDTVGYKRNANNNGWISVKDSTKFSFVGGNCSTNDKGDSQLLSEGYIDASGNLGAVHDAATAHLGSPWRMPTDAEFSALINNCTTTWTTRNGVFGRLVTGKGVYSSKRIFLPAAGYGDDSSLTYLGSDGYYWSSTSYSDYSLYAWFLDFSSGYFCRLYNYRFLGQSVRPVRGFAK